MFVPKAGQNFTLKNPPRPRSTQTKRAGKWKPYASFVAKEYQKGTPSQEIIRILAERFGFEVTPNQWYRYKRNVGLYCPNIRTTGRGVNAAALTQQAQESDDDEPISDMSTSASSYASSSCDQDDEDTWFTETEQVSSSEPYDSSQYETANEAFDAMDHVPDHQGPSPEPYAFPSMISVSTKTLPEELLTLNMSDGLNEADRGAARRALRLYTTLSPSPSISPPQSIRSAYRWREAAVKNGELGDRPLACRPRLPMDDCSSTTSFKTRNARSTTSNHRTKWVYPSNKVRWSAIVKVGRVIDVLEPTISTEDGTPASTHDIRRRQPHKRLVVVRVNSGRFCGVPVRTYRDRGTCDLSVLQRQGHSILHAERTEASHIAGEPEMSKRPLVVQLSSINSKLSAASRINFAKTCFPNVDSGVFRVGKLNTSSICLLERYWQDHFEAKTAP